MKKLLLIALAPVLLVVGAHAAPAGDTGVTTSTDPAKAASVERHAQELAARDAKAAAEPKKATTSKTTTTKTAHKKQGTHHPEHGQHHAEHGKHHAATTTGAKTAAK